MTIVNQGEAARNDPGCARASSECLGDVGPARVCRVHAAVVVGELSAAAAWREERAGLVVEVAHLRVELRRARQRVTELEGAAVARRADLRREVRRELRAALSAWLTDDDAEVIG